ncbi:hypothetical protein ACFQ0M_50155, partial [Kitasatospora aburaviensis]
PPRPTASTPPATPAARSSSFPDPHRSTLYHPEGTRRVPRRHRRLACRHRRRAARRRPAARRHRSRPRRTGRAVLPGGPLLRDRAAFVVFAEYEDEAALVSHRESGPYQDLILDGITPLLIDRQAEAYALV